MGRTEYGTLPLPVPLPVDTEIHPVVVVAVHAQAAAVVRLTAPFPPDESNAAFVGAIVYSHPGVDGGGWGAGLSGGGGAACTTVTVRPAIVIVPVRPAPPLAATEYAAEPLPDPVAPLVIVIQLALLDAVHGHPASALTLTAPDEAPAPTEIDGGSTE